MKVIIYDMQQIENQPVCMYPMVLVRRSSIRSISINIVLIDTVVVLLFSSTSIFVDTATYSFTQSGDRSLSPSSIKYQRRCNL